MIQQRPTGDDDAFLDFEKLCRSIDDTVSQISKAVGKGLGEAGAALGDALNEAAKKAKENQGAASKRKVLLDTPAQEVPQILNAVPVPNSGYVFDASLRKRYRSTLGLTAAGVLMAAIGGIGLLGFGVSALTILAGSAIFSGIPSALLSGTGVASAVIAVLFGLLTASGVKRLSIAGRFNAFRRIIGDREVCSLEELSAKTGKNMKQTIAAACKMLSYGLFTQGHIDDEQTTLMTTNEAYQLYRSVQQERKRLMQEEKAAAQAKLEQQAAADAAHSALPTEARAFVEEGTRCLRRMRELDVSIADAAVSAKIVSIEEIVGRMIERVECEPSVVSLLDKLMDYYLPTTIKLLEAYESLEKQPFQGESIAESRKDIERTLDVLHDAYEKLLEETYRDMTLDVAADISVLNAVLAQEGLTTSPFDTKPERNEHADSE